MKEDKYGYNPAEEDEEEYYDDPQPAQDQSIRGYRIVIGILSVILVAISLLYFSIHREQMRDNQLLAADRDSIQAGLNELIINYDSLRFQNDSIAESLTKANELVEQLKQERRWNYNKMRQYEKELGSLRTVMRGYIRHDRPGRNNPAARPPQRWAFPSHLTKTIPYDRRPHCSRH